MPILALFKNIFENFLEIFYENSSDNSWLPSQTYPKLKPRHLESKGQRAGTLEKVVNYDKEAFDKAWAWMASGPSDDEEEHFFYTPQVSWF